MKFYEEPCKSIQIQCVYISQICLLTTLIILHNPTVKVQKRAHKHLQPHQFTFFFLSTRHSGCFAFGSINSQLVTGTGSQFLVVCSSYSQFQNAHKNLGLSLEPFMKGWSIACWRSSWRRAMWNFHQPAWFNFSFLFLELVSHRSVTWGVIFFVPSRSYS